MKDNIPSGLKWELKSHNHQIADTGDYDGCYELTNGQVSIFTKYDDDEALQKIIDAFNDSDCTDFYLDDSHLWQIKGLEYQLAELREKLQPPSSTSVQVEGKTGVELIAEERKRQREEEGWTPEHDAAHKTFGQSLRQHWFG